MRKSIRATIWIVVCCVVIVSSLGIGVAQSAGNNTTNGTQPVVDSDGQNNTTRVENALRGSNPSQQNQAPKQAGGNSTNESDKRGVPGGKNKNKDKNGTNSSLVAFARHLTEVSSGQANQLLEQNPQKAAKLSAALAKMGYAYPELDRENRVKDAAKFYLKNTEKPTDGGGNKDNGKNKGGGGGGFIREKVFGIINDIGNALANAAAGIVETFTSLVYKAATYTPAPGNIDNWFQNPQNSIWPNQWDLYETITRPLTFFLLVIATGLFYGFGSNSLHVMDPATEQTMKRRLLVGWVMFPVGWSLGSLYLSVIAFITKILGRGMTAPNISGGLGKTIGLLIIIVVLVFEFWTVLLMLMLIGLRIAGLVAFLPFLPLFFALRAIPIVSISNSADAIIHLWVYLALLPLPMGALIAIGFSDGLANMIMQLDVAGVILVACMKMGALVGAIIVPFAMYQKMKDHGFATGFGSSGGGVPGDKLKESYKRQRETAARRHRQAQTGRHGIRNFNRGRRGQPEVRQDGQERINPQGRAHRAGSKFNSGGGESDEPESQLNQGGGGNLDDY
jgi:hypothetical protein